MKAAIYARVSTIEQDYDQQVDACIKYCEIKGWSYEIFTEKQSSTKDRPVYNTIIKRCLHGDFSCLVVFRFDRAWRSSRQFIMDFDSLSNRGCGVISVMEGLDPTTPMGKAIMTVLVALAELERTNISMATTQRLQALKALGKTLGRPKGSKDKKKRRNTGYIIREANKRGIRNQAVSIQDIRENK
jgi:DNA invertase Pin-like site-specific DNA recombinase